MPDRCRREKIVAGSTAMAEKNGWKVGIAVLDGAAGHLMNWNRSVIPPDEVPLIAESFIHHYKIFRSG
jgi:hypothetical protein